MWNAAIILYCARRLPVEAATAADSLRKMGYTNVKSPWTAASGIGARKGVSAENLVDSGIGDRGPGIGNAFPRFPIPESRSPTMSVAAPRACLGWDAPTAPCPISGPGRVTSAVAEGFQWADRQSGRRLARIAAAIEDRHRLLTGPEWQGAPTRSPVSTANTIQSQRLRSSALIVWSGLGSASRTHR